jgi:SAM-dependent methyltransferase
MPVEDRDHGAEINRPRRCPPYADKRRVGARENGGVPIEDRDRRAASFSQVAEVYERARPGYPQAAIEWLLGAEPLDVLDLGAGTGKLTAALLAAGHRVTALEPLDEMRAVLAANLPEATTIGGRAEEVPLADASFDAVVAGSAFHWFDREPALAEVARLLRPPGVFGLLGNRYDTSVDWQRRLRKLGGGGAAIYRADHWPSRPELRERFAEVEDGKAFPHAVEIDAAAIRDYHASTSWVATMEPAEREAHMASIDEFFATDPELRGRDHATLHWRTPVRAARGLLGA